jgi:predicted HTH transcriptional regulator
MNEAIIAPLLYEHESETLDFKQGQYKFYGATDEEKTELLKDILAFANAWKRNDAYILIGLEEVRGGKAIVHGVTEHLKDNDVQQFVSSKTNRSVRFICGTIALEGQQVDVIKIEQQQDRPLFLKRDFGALKRDTVYIRHGSATEVAGPQEIAEMGATRSETTLTVSSIELNFADVEAHKLLGTVGEFTSLILVDPPPPPPPPISKQPRFQGLDLYGAISGFPQRRPLKRW